MPVRRGTARVVGWHVWCDLVEDTQPNANARTYRRGRKYAALCIRVPTWFVAVIRRVMVARMKVRGTRYMKDGTTWPS